MDLKEIYKELKKDFPNEAYSADNSRGFELTSLKAQYVVERLNDVLGINGWSLMGEFSEKENGILFLGKLSLLQDRQEIHSIDAIGFSEFKKNVGDTYKGARTDALSKAASYLGIGNEMFKGKVKVVKESHSSKFEKPEQTNKGDLNGKRGTGFRRAAPAATSAVVESTDSDF